MYEKHVINYDVVLVKAFHVINIIVMNSLYRAVSTYVVEEGASKRGKDVLVDSEGHKSQDNEQPKCRWPGPVRKDQELIPALPLSPKV